MFFFFFSPQNVLKYGYNKPSCVRLQLLSPVKQDLTGLTSYLTGVVSLLALELAETLTEL